MTHTVTTVRVDTNEGPIDALLGMPAGEGPWPGVVVVHDAIGYGPDNAATVARIAAAGYLAITPNLFARGGRVRCVPRVFGEVLRGEGRAFDDVLAARDHLREMPQCTGAIAIVGFCMGGQFALLLGPGNFGAAAPFYGTPLPKRITEVLDASCPVVASFGRRDPMGVGAPARLRAAVAAKGVPADIKVYPHVGHSFANRFPMQPIVRITGFGYDEDATDDAWRRVFAFFDAHLPQP